MVDADGRPGRYGFSSKSSKKDRTSTVALGPDPIKKFALILSQ